MLPETVQRVFSGSWAYVRSLLRNPYWWGGLILLGVLLGVCYLLVNQWLMPKITRQADDLLVAVPSVINRPPEQASSDLEALGLHVVLETEQYNPAYPANVIVDQNPEPSALVKPDRHIYLTVNSGELRRVVVPNVFGFSIREAENRLRVQGLRIEEALPDSIPAPHRNTVTGQEPPAGDTLEAGASVTLWYSTGLGAAYSAIPDIVGMDIEQARDSLLALQLRAIVIGAPDSLADPNAPDTLVLRQSPGPGTQVRAGSEVRLHTWLNVQTEPDTLLRAPYEENEPDEGL